MIIVIFFSIGINAILILRGMLHELKIKLLRCKKDRYVKRQQKHAKFKNLFKKNIIVAYA